MVGVDISAPASEAAHLLQLVATHCGVQDRVAISVCNVSDVEFCSPDGIKAFGIITACRYLASLGSSAKHILGNTSEQQAKVSEWLTYQHTELEPLMDEQLFKVNEWLQNRTYLLGNSLTLADLVVYATVQPAVCCLPVAQHTHFGNLLRWYDFIHHTVDRTAIFPPASFAKPRLVMPPPPAAPQPKAEVISKSTGGGKGAASSAASSVAEVSKAGKKAGAAAADGGVDKKAAAAGKKEKKDKGKDGGTPATPAVSNEAPAGKGSADLAVDLLDIRVGQIVKVGRHPNADSLYVEEIDVGEEKPRQVVSGLVKFVPQEAMSGRRVVVLLNLKPAKMRDVMSYGMVLCASNDAHDAVDPISPPEGVPVGEKVTFEGYTQDPEPQLNPKKKQFEKIAPDLITDASGQCTYKGVPFMTTKGPCTSTIPNAHIK